jgi:hypothetical protein
MSQKAALEYNNAISRFQQKVPAILKEREAKVSGTNSGSNFKYKWANLRDIIVVVRPALFEEGLSFTFDMEYDAGKVTSIFTLRHVLGHSVSNKITVPDTSAAGMSAQQKVGSAREHAKRYAIIDGLGLNLEDEADSEAVLDPATLTREQEATLVVLMAEVCPSQAEKDRYLKFVKDVIGVEALSQIPQVRYTEAVRALENKRKANKK